MSFQFNSIGQRVASDPAGAHAAIAVQFAKLGNSTGAVARQFGVNVSTLRRWLSRLAELGYSDPAGGERARRGVDARPRKERPAPKKIGHDRLKKRRARPAASKAAR